MQTMMSRKMSKRARRLAGTAVMSLMLGAAGLGQAQETPQTPLPPEDLTVYAGSFVDADNPTTRMVIAEDAGILRIRGGNDGFAYELACLVTQAKAACMGNGGKLEGDNFLYESMIEFAEDGSAVETWKAFNNQLATEGSTNWRRDQ